MVAQGQQTQIRISGQKIQNLGRFKQLQNVNIFLGNSKAAKSQSDEETIRDRSFFRTHFLHLR